MKNSVGIVMKLLTPYVYFLEYSKRVEIQFHIESSENETKNKSDLN